jgi:hypothetical protein
MNWTNAVTQLRKRLADNDTDKLSWRKMVFGQVNGTNTIFKTYEWRRVTDFTTAPSDSTLGVYVNDIKVAVTDDDLSVGQFTLENAPVEGDTINATYYNQWFIDNELESFLITACQWLGLGEDYTKIPDGLRPGALKYACAEAYQQLALRWRQMGEMYRVEDLPRQGIQDMINEYSEAAKAMFEDAFKTRDDFYDGRQGQAKQPLFATVIGAAPNPQPKR